MAQVAKLLHEGDGHETSTLKSQEQSAKTALAQTKNGAWTCPRCVGAPWMGELALLCQPPPPSPKNEIQKTASPANWRNPPNRGNKKKVFPPLTPPPRLADVVHVLELLAARQMQGLGGAPCEGVDPVLQQPVGAAKEGHVSDAEAAALPRLGLGTFWGGNEPEEANQKIFWFCLYSCSV